MERSPLVFGLAAVFAGFTVFLSVLAFAFRELLVLVVAVPFAAATYAFWYHATGRLAARGFRERFRTATGEQVGPGARGGARAEADRRGTGADSQASSARSGGDRRRDTRGRARTQQRRAPGADPGPSAAEAYGVLGVEAGADEETVRRAYRERVKETHPDTETGSEEAFKRVKDAYERLTD